MSSPGCPRCGGQIVVNHGERSCLQCGNSSVSTNSVIESSAQLGAACLQTLDGLGNRIRAYEEKIATTRAEALRFLRIAEFCDADIPDELRAMLAPTAAKRGGHIPCMDCERTFGNLHGLAMHRARIHGPGWSTAANFTKSKAAVPAG